ncbi:putative uncharacterized protein DDB_G0286901 isoform X2 [Leptopilina boulardi]|uniref:putative uncharacterized protein DDB_G0286901 isoform X2 n=1 Tax=Leptopilina boulardi TaxID=63433 RepID=UPI0021F577D0|nr:putative uncharacterized protein DDB_G0286901 isoform X2 [Leptopilina boulardi]
MSKVSVSRKLLRGEHIPTIQRIMEISKSLQEEILSVQNKLKNAIRDHQICVEKLKDDPDNPNVLDQIQQIQIYIVSLGRRQKQVVQRLRTEVETLKAESANGSKVSVASLLGLNNNNHIINNNETNEESTDSKNLTNINGMIKKEDYEEEIRNTDDSSPSQENDCSNRERSNSVESISYEDDVVEISADENSNEKQDMEEECSIGSSMQVSFLETLGLITTTMNIELQNRKAERKRRRTANHQFVYSNWELPTKRKRYSYLQSAGKAPQTRQSTARSIGPSPPPGKISNKSLPPSTKNSSKNLNSTQKVNAKPNILRNGMENKILTKNGNENAQLQNNKSLGSKVVHIPGLPSSLTIERIEADSAICISCRNPGTLTVCQQCSSKYHISCHSISPPPSKICPACANNLKDNSTFSGVICKKENELATASYTARGIRKTREDPKINKTTRGFHKTDATSKRNIMPTNFGINQLPSSTYLIPISTSAMSITNNVKNPTINNRIDPSEIRVIDHFTHSGNTTYINKSKSEWPKSSSSSHQESSSDNRDKQQQSYLVVKKIPEPTNFNGGGNSRQNNPILNYQLSSPCGYSATHGNPEMPLIQSTHPFINNNNNKVINRRSESNTSTSKKSNNTRSLPGLNRIYVSNNRQHGFDSSSSDEDNSNDKSSSSGFGNLLNPLFSVNNKSNIIAGSSSETQRRTTTERGDCTNIRQFSQIENSQCYDRKTSGELRSIQSTNNTEHVKLEEAHISAPSRTKLNFTDKKINSNICNDKLKNKLNTKTYERKTKKSPETREIITLNNDEDEEDDDDDDNDDDDDDDDNNDLEKNVIQSSVMEVTIDDTDERDCESPEVIINNIETDKNEEIISNSSSSSSSLSLIKESNEITDDLQNLYNLIKGTLDFIISERKHTSNEIDDLEKSATIEKSCIKKQDDSIEIIDKNISISDEKADIESQDLISDNSRPLIIDENKVNNIPVEEINNSHQSNVSSLEIKESIIIDSVSSEKIELLEQFESAILNINQEING